MSKSKPPSARPGQGLKILSRFLRDGPLGALSSMYSALGNVFHIGILKFRATVAAGPRLGRQILVSHRSDFKWRKDSDPVTKLLRHGFLVEEGNLHDDLRSTIEPALHRRNVYGHIPTITRLTDDFIDSWAPGATVNMLVEMRKLSLLILVDTLFGIDIRPRLNELWPHVLGVIKYISPGVWIALPNLPRSGYDNHIAAIDAFLMDCIQQRRSAPPETRNPNMLDLLLNSDYSDELIRDQLLTILIAGHDTTTANLAWTLYEIGRHHDLITPLQQEIDDCLGSDNPDAEQLQQLELLERTINESLRLHPPIHVSNRVTKCPIHLDEFEIPENSRVMFSIYLTHRDKTCWHSPKSFDPSRFESDRKRTPFSFLPFGGGPRNCVGAVYARVEALTVLARILQRCNVTLASHKVSAHMGATLEPHPHVRMVVDPRDYTNRRVRQASK